MAVHDWLIVWFVCVCLLLIRRLARVSRELDDVRESRNEAVDTILAAITALDAMETEIHKLRARQEGQVR